MFLLVQAALCYKCDHVVTVKDNGPMEYSFNVEEGEYICVNSTQPYLAVVFQQRALLGIRYFKSENDQLQQLGKFEFPADATGVSFATEIGHVEAFAHISGHVSLSTFAFPSLCAGNRYITTMPEEQWILKDKFVTQDEDLCIWNPRPSCSMFDVPVSSEVKSSLKLCDIFMCKAAVDSEGQEPVAIKMMSRNYLRVDLRNPGFVEDFLVKIASYAQKTADWFKISAILDSEDSHVIQVYSPESHFIMSGKEAQRRMSKFGHGMKHDDAESGVHDVHRNVQHHHEHDDHHHVSHRELHRESNILNAMLFVEIISGMSLVVACIVLIVQCFTNKNRRADTAEDRLLPGYGDGSRYPIPGPAQFYPNGYPMSGFGAPNQQTTPQQLDPVNAESSI